jgi:hypothetical protein
LVNCIRDNLGDRAGLPAKIGARAADLAAGTARV